MEDSRGRVERGGGCGKEPSQGWGGRRRGEHDRRGSTKQFFLTDRWRHCSWSSGRCVQAQVFTAARRERSAQSRQPLPCRHSVGHPCVTARGRSRSARSVGRDWRPLNRLRPQAVAWVWAVANTIDMISRLDHSQSEGVRTRDLAKSMMRRLALMFSPRPARSTSSEHGSYCSLACSMSTRKNWRQTNPRTPAGTRPL